MSAARALSRARLPLGRALLVLFPSSCVSTGGDEGRTLELSFAIEALADGAAVGPVDVYLSPSSAPRLLLGTAHLPAGFSSFLEPDALNPGAVVFLSPRGVLGERVLAATFPLSFLMRPRATAFLLPPAVTVVGGPFNGEVVSLNQEAVLGYGHPKVSFLSDALINRHEMGFPMRVAFLRAGYWSGGCSEYHPPAPILREDSIFFWRQVQVLEDRIGMDLFRPESLDRIHPRGFSTRCGTSEPIVPAGIVAVQYFRESAFSTPRPAGWTVKTRLCPVEDSAGECVHSIATSVRVRLLARDEDGGRQPVRWVIHHELFHALGFGHTCFLPSIMSLPGPFVAGHPCEAVDAVQPVVEPEISVYDVALAQLLYRRQAGGRG